MLGTTTSTYSLLLLLLLHVSPTANAFPFAAGACPGGIPAVGGGHVGAGKDESTGLLSAANLVVSLNGIPLVENGDPVSFFVGEDNNNTLELSSTADSGTTFRGFLLRVGHPPTQVVDLRGSIGPISSNDTTTQVATTSCVEVEQVGGLTHTHNDDKTSVMGALTVMAPVEGILLDVTVVLVHDDTTSAYYYSNFVLHAVQEGGVDPEDDSEEIMPLDIDETLVPSMTPLDGTTTDTSTSTGGGIDVDTPDDTLNQGPVEVGLQGESSAVSLSQTTCNVVLLGLLSLWAGFLAQ